MKGIDNNAIEGHFNTHFQSMDISYQFRKTGVELYLEQMALTDIYRTFHLSATEYTFFLSTHEYSIYHMLGHKTSPNKFRKTEI